MENIKNYYYGLEPTQRLEMFKFIYSLIEEDKEILENDEALDSYSEMTINLQNAITQINTVKEKYLHILEENKNLRESSGLLIERNEGFNNEKEELKQFYEKTIQDLREKFREEKANLLKEQIKTPISNRYVESKISISTEVNNFVKLKIEEFRGLKDSVSSAEMFKIYEETKTTGDLKLSILSKFILDHLRDPKQYKLNQTFEKRIMLEIERGLSEGDKEVLDDDYR